MIRNKIGIKYNWYIVTGRRFIYIHRIYLISYVGNKMYFSRKVKTKTT